MLIDLHIYTHANAHSYSSVFEYIMEAKRKNMLAIAITDHGHALDDSPHKWHFLNLNAIPERVEGLRILKGIEANIYENGSIDCDDLMSKKLDFVMAEFHSPFYPPMF
ncbi:MAG: PHP domain-containing protein [Candidatus Malihini olakiniferum]